PAQSRVLRDRDPHAAGAPRRPGEPDRGARGRTGVPAERRDARRAGGRGAAAARPRERGGPPPGRGGGRGTGAARAAGRRRARGRAGRGARGVTTLLAGLVRLLAATWRYRVRGWEHVTTARASGRPVIYVLWHSRILPLLYHRRNEGMALLISRHRDGGYLAQLSERWGYRVVRGSSQRGGDAGLLGLVRHLRLGGEVALTPDGPRGPAERMKPGALAAAQHANAMVIAAGARASSAWWIESWDRFCLPRPFARVEIVYSAPFAVEAGKQALRRGMTVAERALRDVTYGRTRDPGEGTGERGARGTLAVGRLPERPDGTPAALAPRRRVLGRHEAACRLGTRRCRAPPLADHRGRKPVGGRYGENAPRGLDCRLLCGAGAHAGHPAPRLWRGRAPRSSATRAAGGRDRQPRSSGGRGRRARPGRWGARVGRRLPAPGGGAGFEYRSRERRERRGVAVATAGGPVARGPGCPGPGRPDRRDPELRVGGSGAGPGRPAGSA